MAANYGFVYVLKNECMPNIYKIGMTDRSPRQRCAELSSSTAVPQEFELVCVGEVENALDVERELHRKYAHHRVSESREFFQLGLPSVLDLVDDIQVIASSHGGMFCDLASEAMRAEIAFAEFGAHQKEFRAQRIAAMEAFFSQSADLPEWEDPDGFNGFGDARNAGSSLDDLPF